MRKELINEALPEREALSQLAQASKMIPSFQVPAEEAIERAEVVARSLAVEAKVEVAWEGKVEEASPLGAQTFQELESGDLVAEE